MAFVFIGQRPATADRFRYPLLAQRIAERLLEHDMHHRATVTSFAIDTLLSFRESLPDVPLIWLIDRSVVRQIGDLEAVLRIAERRGVREIALHGSDLDERNLGIARNVGLAVGAYPINDSASVRRMFEFGVTVFTTNRPDLAIEVRSEYRLRV